MSTNIKVSASILCADFTRLAEEIKSCEAAGVDGIHVDVMDGQFVPNITIGPLIIAAIRPLTKLPIEAHLMIENPGRFIDDFINAGADIISLQLECYGPRKAVCRQLDQYPKEIESLDAAKMRGDIQRIKKAGRKAFVVVNPGTPLLFDGLLKDIDGVLIMSVNPGFAKQKFMAEVVPKIEQLRRVFTGDIAVDGGINAETSPLVVKAGANVLATASYFFGAKDKKAVVSYLKTLR